MHAKPQDLWHEKACTGSLYQAMSWFTCLIHPLLLEPRGSYAPICWMMPFLFGNTMSPVIQSWLQCVWWAGCSAGLTMPCGVTASGRFFDVFILETEADVCNDMDQQLGSGNFNGRGQYGSQGVSALMHPTTNVVTSTRPSVLIEVAPCSPDTC